MRKKLTVRVTLNVTVVGTIDVVSTVAKDVTVVFPVTISRILGRLPSVLEQKILIEKINPIVFVISSMLYLPQGVNPRA